MRPAARVRHVVLAAVAALLVGVVGPFAAPAQAAVDPGVVLRTAASLAGVPYLSGGTTPAGFDCSGYTRYVFARSGRTLPRTAAGQHAAVRRVARGDLRPGDLLFFRDGTRIYHVGIYAGRGTVWHSPKPGRRVSLVRVWTTSWVAGRA